MRRVVLVLLLLLATPATAEPLSLFEAGRRALLLHPDLDLAQNEIKAAEARAGRAQSPFYPEIGAVVSLQDAASDNGTPSDPLRFRPPNDQLWRLRGTQIVTDFGKRKALAQSADLQALASQRQAENVLQQRLLAVGTAYFSLNRATQLSRLEKRNLELSRKRVEEARKLRTGDSCGPDEAVAETDEVIAQSRVLEARNEEELARVELANAMGDKEPYQEELQNCLLSPPVSGLDDFLQQGLAQRPELQAARANVGAAEYDVKASRASYRPEVSLNADYGFYALGYPWNLRSWRVGVDLAVPLFNEPFLSESVALAESNLAAAQAREKQAELTVYRDVQRNAVNVELALKRTRQAAATSRQAFLTFVEVWSLYKTGLGSCRDVSLAQRDYISSEQNAINTEFELQAAILSLYRSSGELRLEVLDQTLDATRFRRSLRLESP